MVERRERAPFMRCEGVQVQDSLELVAGSPKMFNRLPRNTPWLRCWTAFTCVGKNTRISKWQSILLFVKWKNTLIFETWNGRNINALWGTGWVGDRSYKPSGLSLRFLHVALRVRSSNWRALNGSHKICAFESGSLACPLGGWMEQCEGAGETDTRSRLERMVVGTRLW